MKCNFLLMLVLLPNFLCNAASVSIPKQDKYSFKSVWVVSQAKYYLSHYEKLEQRFNLSNLNDVQKNLAFNFISKNILVEFREIIKKNGISVYLENLEEVIKAINMYKLILLKYNINNQNQKFYAELNNVSFKLEFLFTYINQNKWFLEVEQIA